METDLFRLHTLKEESSSFSFRTSLIVLPTTLMTRSITCTTPFVATWLAWMILAQFTVTTFRGRRIFGRHTEAISKKKQNIVSFLCENGPHWSSGWCRGPACWTWKQCLCRSSGLWWGNGGSPYGSEERCAGRCWRCSPVKRACSEGTTRGEDLGPVSVAAFGTRLLTGSSSAQASSLGANIVKEPLPSSSSLIPAISEYRCVDVACTSSSVPYRWSMGATGRAAEEAGMCIK